MNPKITLLWTLVALFAVKEAAGQASHTRLVETMFAQYDTRHLPSDGDNHTVTLAFTLTGFHHLDLFKGTVDLTGWLKMVWKDTRLRWDPSQFDGLSSLSLPASDVWVPDIKLYESYETVEIKDHVNALVQSSGDVYFIPPMRVTASCYVNVEEYPYDEQKCALKWGSWTHHNERITLAVDTEMIDLSFYTLNTVLEVTGTSVDHQIEKFDCCPESYESVTFTIRLRRRESHGRIAAAVVTTWLILAVFLIPPTSGAERFIFAGFLVVSLVIMSAALTVEVPASSTTRLGRFQLAGLLLIALVTIYNGLIYRFSPKEQRGEMQLKSNAPRICLFIDIIVFFISLLILAIVTGSLFV